MGTRYVLPVLALGALAVALGGCTDIKRAIGMEKVIPDEFAVVSRAPLAIPPDYSLRPPQPGAAPSQEVPTQERAKEAIFRVGQSQTGLPAPAAERSPGEDDLLRQAGVANADPKIRAVVTEEQQASPEGEKTFVDKLLFWRKSTPNEVVDPAKEADRIKQAQTAGQPVAPDAPGASAQAETAAPTIERKKSTSFMNLF